MPDIYLHVGFPKTGTTFLQNRCFPKLKGIRVVSQEHGGPRSGLIRQLWHGVTSYPLFIDMDEHREEIARSLRDIPQDKILISSELLVGSPHLTFLNHPQYTAYLRELFPSARIILTIRRQDTFLESMYRQCLWAFYHPTINDYLNYQNGRFAHGLTQPPTYPFASVRNFDFRVFARSYAAAFGRENLLVLPQEMLRADPRRFHSELADFLGVEPYFPPEGAVDANASYSLLSCRIALLLNGFVRLPGREARPWHVIPHEPLTPYLRRLDGRGARTHRLLDALNRRLSLRYVLQHGVDRLFPQRGTLIGADKRRMILDIHREANRGLDEDHGIDLKRYGYY